MREDQRPILITPRQLEDVVQQAVDASQGRVFSLTDSFTPENVVEIAKSQFPRLEAEVAMRRQAEQTRRLLIIVAAICLVAGATLVVFAPAGKEGVSYVVALLLAILPLGAIGVNEFRIRVPGAELAGRGEPPSKGR